MSYKTFHKKVLGEKVKDLNPSGTKKKEVVREVAINKIKHMNNSLLIIDEAHQITGNSYGESVMEIIKKSINLKVVLLSATPMKNKADDIVDMLNFIRPINDPIKRDMVFSSKTLITEIEFKPGGKEYLEKMASGYVSHYRGANPLTFAKRIEKGTKPKSFLFTNIVRCKMLFFQKKVYEQALVKSIEDEDTLNRKLQSAANMVLPVMDANKKNIIGLHGTEGITTITEQIKNNHTQLCHLLNQYFFKSKYPNPKELVYLNNQNRLTGKIFTLAILKLFSIKFYKALKKINRNINKEAGTIFVNSNLVVSGANLFHEILIQNGYLEYMENDTYNITDNTICYMCGKRHRDHDDNTHEFHPATFMVMTGQNEEDEIPEQKYNIIQNVFNNIDNRFGKFLKIIVGTKVMHEGVNLSNVKQVHILDFFWNLGRNEQIVGRAIRHCRHYNIMSRTNPFPQVAEYKYVVSNKNDTLTPEEIAYQKAEKKYIMIKEIERLLKTIAIDCPLNHNGNIIPEEVKLYKDCEKKGPYACPRVCDFQSCEYMCKSKALNLTHYDKNSKIYKQISAGDLDYTTFNNTLARTEIEYAKMKIKEMYRVNHVYVLPQIVKKVKEEYAKEKKELFEDFFIYKALDELLPVTENDFNNFKDNFRNINNQPGYLIHRGEYYIFQPMDQNENATMMYRTRIENKITKPLTLKDFSNHYDIKSLEKTGNLKAKKFEYIFTNLKTYYEGREENKYVGIIDLDPSKKSTETKQYDVFKIRNNRIDSDKKRGTGIQSLTGSVCISAKSKQKLFDMAKELNVDENLDEIKSSKKSLCQLIHKKLLKLEKYSEKPITFFIIPTNHAIYPFPLNLIDRIEFFKQMVIKFDKKKNVVFNVEKENNGKFFDMKKMTSYKITIPYNQELAQHIKKNRFNISIKNDNIIVIID